MASGLVTQIFATASGYPYLTVNAFNPWALVAGDTGNSLANSGLWPCDGPWTVVNGCAYGVASIAGIPPVLIGGVLMLAVTLAVSLIAARRPDRITILLRLTILAIAFYVVPTRVHERYAYPVFALAIILAAVAWRWRLAYVALTMTVFLNMYAALTNPFYENPGSATGWGSDRRSVPSPASRSSRWPTARSSCGRSPSCVPAPARAWPSELAFERELAADEEWQDEPDDEAIPAPAGGLATALPLPGRCPRARRHRRPRWQPMPRAPPSPRPWSPSPRWHPGRHARPSTSSASSAG